MGLSAAVLALLAACGAGPAADPVASGDPSTATTASPAPAASKTTGGVASTAAPAAVNDKVYLGAYLDLKGKNMQQSLALRRSQFGRAPRILQFFYAWEDSLTRQLETVPNGSIPLISWRAPKYNVIINGSQDSRIARAARSIKGLRRPVFLRWGWEMNGDWYGWSGAKNGKDTKGYITSWRRIHKIFSDQDVRNVAWVWSPNYNSQPDEPWNAIDNYYPGDEYVDWVGTSGYNFFRESPDTLFDPIYNAYSERKPIMLAETGAVDRGGSSKADWIGALRAWINSRPRVGALVWFDTDTHPGSTESWRVDSNPAALAAYQAMANDPRFSP